MDSLTDFLASLGVLSNERRISILNSSCPASNFIKEAKNGVILAKLGLIIDPGSYNESDIALMPTLSVQRERNIKLFLRACKRRRITSKFGADNFCFLDDSELMDKLLKTLRNVAKKMGHKLEYMSIEINADSKEEREKKMRLDVSLYSSDSALQVSDVSHSSEQYYFDYIYGNNNDARNDNCGLKQAVQELITVESKYRDRVWLFSVVHKHIPSSSVLAPLKKVFAVDMSDTIDQVLKVHKELEQRLGSIDERGTGLGSVFSGMQEQLLVYAPFIERCSNIKHFIYQHRSEKSINDAMRAVQQSLNSSCSSSKMGSSSISLSELLTIPMQHVVRYLLLLQNVFHHAQKQIAKLGQKAWLVSLLEELEKGLVRMRDLNHFINAYFGDANYLASIADELAKHEKIWLPDDWSGDLCLDYGYLMQDASRLFVRRMRERRYSPRSMFVFQTLILVCRSVESGNNRYLEAEHWIRMDDVVDVRLEDNDKNNTLAVVVADKSVAVVAAASIYIRSSNASELDSLHALLSRLIRLRESKLHSSPGQLLKAKEGVESPLRCDDCDRLLYGRVVVGIHCRTCDKKLHESCFYQGQFDPVQEGLVRPDPDSEDSNKSSTEKAKEEDNTREDSREAKQNEQNDDSLLIGTVSDLSSLLSESSQLSSGTFLVYRQEDTGHLRVAVRTCLDSNSSKKMFVQKYKVGSFQDVGGQERFFIRGKSDNKSFQSLSEMISFYASKNNFKVNLMDINKEISTEQIIKDDKEKLSIDNDNKESPGTEESEDNSSSNDESSNNESNSDSEETSGSSESTECSSDESESASDDDNASEKSNGINKINKAETEASSQGTRRDSSVKPRPTVPPRPSGLGSRIKSSKKEHNDPKPETGSTKPEELSFYVGRLDNVRAQRLLSGTPKGTYLLRKNPSGRLRLSFNHPPILHLEVEQESKGFRCGRCFGQTVLELIEELKRFEGDKCTLVKAFDKEYKGKKGDKTS